MIILTDLYLDAVSFGRTLVGLVVRPYETYRRIVERGRVGELTYLALLLSVYFALASLVRSAAFRPYLLTKEFLVLCFASAASYLFMSGVLWVVTQWFGGRGTLRGFLLAWAYSLVPTVFWFLATSVLYVILPPPRTTTAAGMLFSTLYLTFTIALAIWKIVLYYLTLRFGRKLDLSKIVLTTAVAAPIVGFYSYGLYRLGIYRIPFL